MSATRRTRLFHDLARRNTNNFGEAKAAGCTLESWKRFLLGPLCYSECFPSGEFSRVFFFSSLSFRSFRLELESNGFYTHGIFIRSLFSSFLLLAEEKYERPSLEKKIGRLKTLAVRKHRAEIVKRAKRNVPFRGKYFHGARGVE